MSNTSISPANRTLSGATTLVQSGPESDGNKRVLCIPQSFDITETSPSGCLISYPGYSLRVSYPSSQIQSVYSIAPTVWGENNLNTGVWFHTTNDNNP